jgi:hypothetical protein
MPFVAAAENREAAKWNRLLSQGRSRCWRNLRARPLQSGRFSCVISTPTARSSYVSAINPIERLVEHVFVPVAVPCLHIGLCRVRRSKARILD